MKIDFKYQITDSHVYVMIYSELLCLSEFMVFNENDFFQKYKLPADKNRLKEDMIDTMVNVQASIPYSKERLMSEMKINVYANMIKYAKSHD